MQLARVSSLAETPDRPYRRAGVVLFFLAPFVGELLSTSAPPAEYFSPLGFVMLHILYGGGAILARELTVRWKKGFPTLLLLGAAYGIAEEGLMCKSFFDPGWMDLGKLGTYGRALGVNWIWAVELTIYHAVFSIAIPVAIVSLLWPGHRTRPWIGRWALRSLLGLWILNGAFIFLAITPYRPPLVPFVGAAAIAIGLMALARTCPSAAGLTGSAKPARAVWFWLLGLLATPAFFLSAWALPQSDLPVWLTAGSLVGVPALTLGLVYWLSGRALQWLPRQLAALIFGGLCFLLFLCVVRANEPDPPDNPRGLTAVAAVALAGLIGLDVLVRRRVQPAAGSIAAGGTPETRPLPD